jgi:AhpD family alkylhydroperoxidase
MTTHQNQPRLELKEFHQLAPETTSALRSIGQAVNQSSLEPLLVELVKMRASQINGCAFCLNMHFEDALKLGETPQRLNLLSAWHEAPVFSERERAALAWTESLTLIADDHVPDEVYEEVSQHFSKQELALLTAAVITINAWNRIAIAYRATPELKSQS